MLQLIFPSWWTSMNSIVIFYIILLDNWNIFICFGIFTWFIWLVCICIKELTILCTFTQYFKYGSSICYLCCKTRCWSHFSTAGWSRPITRIESSEVFLKSTTTPFVNWSCISLFKIQRHIIFENLWTPTFDCCKSILSLSLIVISFICTHLEQFWMLLWRITTSMLANFTI